MALLPDQKFSTFQDGGNVEVGDTIVGLRGGINTRFLYTGELSPTYIVPIDQGGTGATTASGARLNLGLGTIAVQDADAVAITGGTASIASGQVLAVPVNADDITNKAYVDALDAGNVKSVSGTANQIDSTGGANPVLTISSTVNLPGTFTIQSTTAVSAIINDNTMATALATNLATALSTKTYIDTQISSGTVISLSGTPNQVLVNGTSGIPTAGAVTLTLPQSIGTGSSPTFNGLTLTSGTIATIPSSATDIVNKSYVDSIAQGITVQGACYAGTTADLSGYTYNNGASGVGATLTAGSNGAFSTDGVSPAINARILVKNQSTASQNGIYTLTTVGTAGTPAILTRATDYDQASEINPGDLVVITAGTTLTSSSWLQTATVTTIGVDSISFSQFTASLPVTVPFGGTGNTTLTAYAILTGGTTATGALQQLGTGSTGQILQSNGASALATFSTATYPNTVTANNILYASGSNVVGQLTPGTSVLTGLQTAINTSGGFTTPAIAGTSGNFCKNIIIGGDFTTNPWQRGTSFAALANGGYSADRWIYSYTSAQVATLSQSTDAPTVAQAGILTNNSLLHTITTADNSIAAGDVCGIAQRIEGYNFTRIAQREFTLSFWVKSNITGTYCVAFYNSGDDRSYVAEYTINSASTWEVKTITVSASPSAGTWNYTTGIGLYVNFGLACGSTYQTTAGSWQTGSFRGTSNQVNNLATNGNTFQLALVQIEAGSVATPFEIRGVQQEIALCQRYYHKSFGMATAPAQSVGTGSSIVYSPAVGGAVRQSVLIRYPVSMRSSPTATYYNPSAANANWRNITGAADSGAAGSIVLGENYATIGNPQVAGDVAGTTLAVHYAYTAEL